MKTRIFLAARPDARQPDPLDSKAVVDEIVTALLHRTPFVGDERKGVYSPIAEPGGYFYEEGVVRWQVLPGLSFQDGRPLRARDLAWTLRHYVESTPRGADLLDVEGPAAGAVTERDGTVELRVRGFNPGILRRLTDPGLALRVDGDDRPSASGPYRPVHDDVSEHELALRGADEAATPAAIRLSLRPPDDLLAKIGDLAPGEWVVLSTVSLPMEALQTFALHPTATSFPSRFDPICGVRLASALAPATRSALTTLLRAAVERSPFAPITTTSHLRPEIIAPTAALESAVPTAEQIALCAARSFRYRRTHASAWLDVVASTLLRHWNVSLVPEAGDDAEVLPYELLVHPGDPLPDLDAFVASHGAPDATRSLVRSARRQANHRKAREMLERIDFELAEASFVALVRHRTRVFGGAPRRQPTPLPMDPAFPWEGASP